MEQAVNALAQVPGVEAAATNEAVKYGIVGILCIVFAWVIIKLYRENREDRKEGLNKEKAHVAELSKCQEQCKTEKETMKFEFERKHREVIEGYTALLAQKDEAMRKREDAIRVETTQLIEKLAAAAERRDEAMGEMLQQFLNKIVK